MFDILLRSFLILCLDPNLFANISSSRKIVTAIDRLASYGEEPSDDDDDSDEGEIVALARKTLDYVTDGTNGANGTTDIGKANVEDVGKVRETPLDGSKV